MRHCTCLYGLAQAGAVLVLGLIGCAARGPGTVPAPVEVREVAPEGSSAAWEAAAGLVNLQPGPVVQFDHACARCHGPQGSMFDASLVRADLRYLRRRTAEMMKGPGQLRPSPGQVHAMTAYLDAIRTDRPFVVVDNAVAFAGDQALVLRGEVTPGATVEVRKDGRVTTADMNGMTWMLANPPRPPFSIEAVQDGKRAGFAFPLHQWSQPAIAPGPIQTQEVPMPSGRP